MHNSYIVCNTILYLDEVLERLWDYYFFYYYIDKEQVNGFTVSTDNIFMLKLVKIYYTLLYSRTSYKN
jgi:hypothetical protein